MRIHLVFPQFPPQLDGIGDYTAHMAAALVRQDVEIKVLTAQDIVTELPGVEVEHAFSVVPPSGVSGLSTAIRDDHPDWVIVQYNPFSYGHWGFNPWLPRVLSQLKREHPRLLVAIMVHEPFVPVTKWQFAIMTIWQRWQLRKLGHTADLVVFAIESWTKTLRPYVSKRVQVAALPVGSNIPDGYLTRDQAREALGIGSDEFVVGIFGSARRLLSLIRAAVDRLASKVHPLRVLYVGPDGMRLRSVLGESTPLLDLGPRPASEVSRALRAMDIHLAPYPCGVSARRGAFVAGLQHGIPTVSTVGDDTDAFIARMNGEAHLLLSEHDREGFAKEAVALAGNPIRRRRMAAAARAMYKQHFEWDHLAAQLLQVLVRGQASDARSDRDISNKD